MNIAQALKRKRQAERLSFRALGARLGVSFSSLARIERGEGQPSHATILALKNWLGWEITEDDRIAARPDRAGIAALEKRIEHLEFLFGAFMNGQQKPMNSHTPSRHTGTPAGAHTLKG